MTDIHYEARSDATAADISTRLTSDQAKAPSHRPALMVLASLFFVWGFARILSSTLLPHLRTVFDLSYTQTALIGSVWFVGYFVASLPAARAIETIGYRHSLVTGLLLMAASALLMIWAAAVPSYGLVLIALFVMVAGAAMLEVAANPYVAAMGSPQSASSRLTLAHAINSLGTMLAPLFGGWLILSHSRSGVIEERAAAALSHAERLADAQSVELPYFLMAVMLAALAVLVARCPLPEVVADGSHATDVSRKGSIWRHRNLVWAVPAIFAYVLTENGCASLFINLVSQPQIGNLTHVQAAHHLFFLWGGMLVRRFVGGALLQRHAPEHVLAGASISALLVLLVTTFCSGSVVMWALISVGLFHSIMFPIIFALGIRGLGSLTKAGSGFLVMAIGGGALVVVQGWLADLFGPQLSFLLPAACELYILLFAVRDSRDLEPVNRLAF